MRKGYIMKVFVLTVAVTVSALILITPTNTNFPSPPPRKVLMAFGANPNDPTWIIDVIGDENFRISSDPGGVRFLIDSSGNVYMAGPYTQVNRQLQVVYTGDTGDAASNQIYLQSTAGSIIQSVTTAKKLDYDAQTAEFHYRKTITGQTSGATALIIRVDDAGSTGTLILSNVSGTFQD